MRSILSALPPGSWLPPSRAVRSPRVGSIYARRPSQQIRCYRQMADDPSWVSVVDRPSQTVRAGKRHGPGLILLALIPVISFALGTWQIKRLDWKTNLIAKYEDRLVKPPLPLPPRLDPDAVPDFDHRRVTATGYLRHDQEMLVGPRTWEGKNGFTVVTPLERDGGESTVLVNRGWIPKSLQDPKDRPAGLPRGEVTIEGMLREPWKKNMFTPDNQPEEGKFYFPDVSQMAELTGSQPIWIDQTMVPDMVEAYNREANGVPIGRAPEVKLRNNHTQYIFTWPQLGTVCLSQHRLCCGRLSRNDRMKAFAESVKAGDCE